MQLTRDAYMMALKSPIVTIVVGDTGDKIPCPLAFLALHSEYFAKVLSKPGAAAEHNGQLPLHRVSKSSVECFVHWCYLGQPLALGLNEGATIEQLRDGKDTLIDLWIFTDEHNIGRLQNEAMTCLRELLGVHPFLLNKEDIFNIFTRTPEPQSPLRRLAITVLVAQLHTPGTPCKIEDFDTLLFTGALSMLFRSMRNWVLYAGGPRKPEEKQNLLLALLDEPRIVEKLNVQEDEPAGWVLTMCGIAPKSEASGSENEPVEVD